MIEESVVIGKRTLFFDSVMDKGGWYLSGGTMG